MSDHISQCMFMWTGGVIKNNSEHSILFLQNVNTFNNTNSRINVDQTSEYFPQRITPFNDNFLDKKTPDFTGQLYSMFISTTIIKASEPHITSTLKSITHIFQIWLWTHNAFAKQFLGHPHKQGWLTWLQSWAFWYSMGFTLWLWVVGMETWSTMQTLAEGALRWTTDYNWRMECTLNTVEEQSRLPS